MSSIPNRQGPSQDLKTARQYLSCLPSATRCCCRSLRLGGGGGGEGGGGVMGVTSLLLLYSEASVIHHVPWLHLARCMRTKVHAFQTQLQA